MAVTSIWPVKGRVDTVINYTRNPEKTTEKSADSISALHAVGRVVEYAANDIKTERRMFVTCLNCTESAAAKQFIATKKLWRKTDGRVCYHAYQSFRKDELSAETAHEIGLKLAKALWGDRFEVVVATHLNTGHYHNHFVINSVSFADGYKFYNSHDDRQKMRDESDRLCREYGLNVITSPEARAKAYAQWKAERDGKPTIRDGIRQDIDSALAQASSFTDFKAIMDSMGYEFKTTSSNGELLRYPALKPRGAKGYFRFHKLGAGYSMREIEQRINERRYKLHLLPVENVKKHRTYFVRGHPKAITHKSGLYRLYLYYCYKLKIIGTKKASARRVPFSMREDVLKLDRYIAQTRFLGRNHINTPDELNTYRAEEQSRIDAFKTRRSELKLAQQKARRHGDADAVFSITQELHSISVSLMTAVKEVKYCDDIARRCERAAENSREYSRRENVDYEYIRRSGRADRADVAQRS